MKLTISNVFTEDIFEREREKLAAFEPIEYEKFRDGRVADFNTVEELCDFLDEADSIFGMLGSEFEIVVVQVLKTNWYSDDEEKMRITIDTIPLY